MLLCQNHDKIEVKSESEQKKAKLQQQLYSFISTDRIEEYTLRYSRRS
jgi:hypothetical protein